MTQLISLDNVSLAFGLHPLLDHVQLQITAGERVCLIGRNGAGKSSLLKIIEGSAKPDSGNVWRKPNLRMSRLEQELPNNINMTVFEYVAEGLSEIGKLLAEFYRLADRIAHSHQENDLTQLEKIQHALDAKNGWQFEQQIKNMLDRLELPSAQLVSALSGGWQRRAALAKALVNSPEILLLDEPTNHLDISGIQWLENELVAASGMGIVFITHDRTLLRRLATRIIELDRGNLTSWPGDYDNFLRRKEEMLHAEAKQNAEFDKKLAQEERWIRQGIKARRTRNEGRVRALEAMRALRAERREIQGKANFALNEGEKSGKLVIEAKHISHGFSDKIIINDFSTIIMRGDRIGLLGPNGIGKSTLLNILLVKLNPDRGTVKLGTNLKVAYFDQLRATLNLEKTVIDNVAQGSDIIEVNGKKQHIISYLGDFLFTPERARTPVKALSGGEANRLLLAKLFSQPANLLVLDEPTNDLDMETLDLLEEILANFQGTLLIVSHDRTFLDNVVTSTIVFEGNGIVKEYVGGYQDWLRQRSELARPVVEKPAVKVQTSSVSKKLSYKEQRELNELPDRINQLENELAELQKQITSEDFYKQAHPVVSETLNKLKSIEEKLQQAYQRWDELESK